MEPDKKIAPCPLSRQYRIDENHAWQSLTVYFLYRLTLGSVLAFLFFMKALPTSLGKANPQLYGFAAYAYLASVVLSAAPVVLRRPAFSIQAPLQIVVDIGLIPIMMHASGGIESGLGVLLGLAVAAGGLLIGGRCALLFAALASLMMLGAEVYTSLVGLTKETHYAYAGMLGASYFGIALLAMVLARRAEHSDAIAAQRSTDVANLQQLNEFVIHHLQSGILVVDNTQRIRMSNESAARLLAASPGQQSLDSLCPDLGQHFRDWLQDPTRDSAVIRIVGSPALQVRFTRLGQTQPPIHMIFLEDNTVQNERVQQSKLASLGRLAASIAHEIRNPLSAINHAGQLLAESESIQPADRRLIQIILEHAARLNTVIENVLQISRRRQSARETIPLIPILRKFLREFQMQNGLDETVFELEDHQSDPWVSIDPTHLKQILENLCSNALKYGNPQCGPIRLSVAHKHGVPCVEFTDHALPIDAPTAQQIFEPFFTTSPSGTGLGLYIARELAELNQARLEYATEDDRSCFRLYLVGAVHSISEP